MKIASSNICRMAFTAAAALALHSQAAQADENGVSLWLPGQFGSLAAAPAVPGWSLGTIAYHTSVEASGNVAAARQISIGRVPATANVDLNANLNARGDLLFIAPTYTFATPVLGGQLAVGVIGVVGNLDTSLAGTLTAQIGPIVATRSGVLSDSFTGVGDLYPLVTLKWNQGVHNYMVYGFGDIPVGAYDSTRLSNIGIATAASTSAPATRTSTRQQESSFPASAASPTISRIPPRNIKMASTSILTGVPRIFYPNNCLSAWSDMPTSRSLTTLVQHRS